MLTLERHLKDQSLINEDNLKLYNSWEVLKIQIMSKLETVSNYFPHFSLHDASHSKTICQQIERFLGEDRIRKLSVSDTWMLLMAFYSHDLGMALKYNDVMDFFYSEEFRSKLLELANSNISDISNAAKRLAKFEKISVDKSKVDKDVYEKSINVFNDVLLIIETHFRERHAFRTTKYIDGLMERFNINNFINIRFITLLNQICIKHQQDIEEISKLPYMTNGLSDDYLHPRFIAGMLCLGDLLDLDTDRFNEYLLESSSPLPSNSKLHLDKHKSIKQFLVTPNGIEIESDASDLNVFRTVREWVEWLKKTTDFLAKEWKNISPDDFGYAPVINVSRITINGSDKWASFSDLEFTISKKRAIELLQGANIYYNKFICIREIIQNAIDASLIQLWTELKIQHPDKYNEKTLPIDIDISEYNKYSISVNIYLKDTNHVIIEITDKGTGISSNDLRAIAKIGTHDSKKNNNIINTMPNWLKPSGAFGLGLQSVFMIADSFEIITKTDNEPAKKITLESGNSNHGYISIEDYSGNITRGTKVIITINEDKIKESDLHIHELDLSMQPKSVWIWRQVYLEITNDYHRKRNIGKENYFKINLETQNPITNENKSIALIDKIVFDEHLQEIFDGRLTGNGEYDGALIFEYFDCKNICLCKIAIPMPTSEVVDGNKVIQKAARYSYIFNKSIFYKNVLVQDGSFIPYSMSEDKLFKYIDFSLNILDQTADEILNLSRNQIKRDAESNFINLAYSTLEHTIKKFIDKIIDIENVNCSQYLIILYQLCIYYNYRTEEFLQKYGARIREYLYGSYTLWNPSVITNKGTKAYSFDDLNSITINLIVKNQYLSLLDKSVIQQFEAIDMDSGCYIHSDNSADRYTDNIISHEIVQKTVKRFNDEAFYCHVIRPFRIRENTVIPQKDEIALLDDFIESIVQNYRSIKVNCEFQSIATDELKNNIDHEMEKRIQLPFSYEDYTYIKEIVFFGHYDKFDKEKFFTNIFSSKYYLNMVEYVSRMNNLEVVEVERQYKKLLQRYLDLLINKEEYRDYVKAKIENRRID